MTMDQLLLERDELRLKNEDLQARVRDLEKALGQNTTRLELVFGVPGSLAKLLGLLLVTPLVTPEMIQDRVGIVRDYKNCVFRLRKHMSQFDVVISSKVKVGYWLTNEMKVRVQKMIADH